AAGSAGNHCPRSSWARWATTRPRTATQPETFSQTHPPIWQELTEEICSACASMRGWAPRHFLRTFSPSLSKPCKSFLNSVRSPEDPAHCPTPLTSSPRRGPYTLHPGFGDRKSTRLNSSHVSISYAVFCLKKKKSMNTINTIPYKKKIKYDELND